MPHFLLIPQSGDDTGTDSRHHQQQQQRQRKSAAASDGAPASLAATADCFTLSPGGSACSSSPPGSPNGAQGARRSSHHTRARGDPQAVNGASDNGGASLCSSSIASSYLYGSGAHGGASTPSPRGSNCSTHGAGAGASSSMRSAQSACPSPPLSVSVDGAGGRGAEGSEADADAMSSAGSLAFEISFSAALGLHSVAGAPPGAIGGLSALRLHGGGLLSPTTTVPLGGLESLVTLQGDSPPPPCIMPDADPRRDRGGRKDPAPAPRHASRAGRASHAAGWTAEPLSPIALDRERLIAQLQRQQRQRDRDEAASAAAAAGQLLRPRGVAGRAAEAAGGARVERAAEGLVLVSGVAMIPHVDKVGGAGWWMLER
jgi:hypothetical protein